MTKSVVTVHCDAPIEEVAACLRKNRIHRVWVVTDTEELCGVISALDLMPVIERGGSGG